MDSSDLFLEDLVAQAPEAGEPATAGVSHELAATCTPVLLSVTQIGQALEPLLLGFDVLQMSETGAHISPRWTSRRNLQDRIDASQLSDLRIPLPNPNRLIGSNSRPQTSIDLGFLRLEG